jgi:transposase
MAMAHVAGQSRYQATLFPESLDEVVPSDHPVRVIDAFVDGLDLVELGFGKVVAEATGRPPYAPGDLLKLYIWGYLNQVRSSRRLEREAGRNIEVMWLINRLAPAFKTIADFRKDHPRAIVGVCRAFVRFCREQALFGATLLAIDGTKIAAVASRKKVVTPAGIARATAAIDRKIAEHLAAMDAADREDVDDDGAGRRTVAAALEVLQQRRTSLQVEAAELAREGKTQKVLLECEARLMRTPQGHAVAYNAQIAVDSSHHLIAAFDLTNEGNDQQQLHPMAVQGKAAVAADQLTVVADTGYSNGEHGARCEQDGITAVVPRAATVNTHGKQYFSRDAFRYDRTSDSWRCPAGETLVWRRRSQAERYDQYWSDACGACALKPHCTAAPKRMIARGFHEDARDTMARRAADPAWMRFRRATAEHPFGTMKWLMGHPRFLVRGMTKAKAELALGVLGYNLKRVLAVLGVPEVLAALSPAPA